MFGQYSYNNGYQSSAIDPQYVYPKAPFKNENQLREYDCLHAPPHHSPRGFRWIKIYPHFIWNGHHWQKRNVDPHWALIDEHHPCNPREPHISHH
jgi:hypothetical protein